uniref:helicase-related protein n=1 Tax=Accumulibacter sp. TaxID=2053492 RepID=UPI0035AEC1F0
GGVPADRRGALVDRFHSDADCRVFLSTDAGGVGLNLQHAAAVVVNMDLPWNPAVLEQRIGRVHRLGQTRGVQVVNFVARGTIEEGMLAVLAFKQSLFSGVLDGGDDEVVLQGSRLARFMETVDRVTGEMAGESTASEDERRDTPPLEATAEAGVAPAGDGEEEYQEAGLQVEGVVGAGELPPPAAAAAPAAELAAMPPVGEPEAAPNVQAAPTVPATSADPWSPLLSAGVQLLGELAAAASGERQSPWVQSDPATGERFLKLPVPDPQTVQRLAEGLLGLLGGRK